MSTEPITPRRRRDLVLESDDGRGLVIDPRAGMIHHVTPAELEAVRVMDGRHDLTAVAKKSALSVRRIRALVRRLVSDHLLESPAVEARLDRHDEDLERHRLDTPERAARIRRLPVADERTRWDCHGCGMCCKGLSVPLRPDEIARIDPALYEDVLAGRSFHVPFVATGGDDIERVLRQVGRDERCVFLAQDGRCLVHARQGASFKPDTCQLFPLATIVTARGPRLTLRIACASLHESQEAGSPLSRYVDECYALEVRETTRGCYAAPMGGEKVGFEAYERIEQRWRELLDEHSASRRFVAEAIAVVPGGRLEQHRRDRRALGRAIRERIELDKTAPSPLVGWFAGKLGRSPAMRRALAALAAGREPPEVPEATAQFVAGTLRQVLWACEPYKVPDIQVGFRGLLLMLELILHTTGPRGTPAAASRATRLWWMAGYEDGELTPLIWQALRAS